MVDHPDKRPWPVPFAIEPVLALRGRRVAVLASGDPFWHGAGGVLAQALEREEWRAYPVPSVVSLAAARMGWRLEQVLCLGLHAAPLARLRRHLAPGVRAIVTVGDAPALAGWLVTQGFGATRMTVMERLGGPHERLREAHAATFDLTGIDRLVTVALEVAGTGRVFSRASGLADDLFDHDGQITKRPIRALAMSALAPRPGEMLWDIGAGSGSVGIEWLLADATTRCIGIEADPVRAARARANAARMGVDLDLRDGLARDVLPGLPRPDAVFLGGGADTALMTELWDILPPGTRLVAHAVTLESEALLTIWQARAGGNLLRIELSEAAPLGRKRGWRASYPVVQWHVTK